MLDVGSEKEKEGGRAECLDRHREGGEVREEVADDEG